MASETEICNLALSLLGEEPITSIDDPQNKTEQLMAMQYPLMRDAVLSEADWSFALQRYRLGSPDPVAPVWGYTYKYTLPSEVLRVVFCSDSTDESLYSPNFKWDIEGGYLVTNNSPVYIRAITRVTNNSLFSNLFIQALAARLAMEVCLAITSNQQLYSAMVAMYGEKLQLANTMDSMQGKARKFRTGQLRGSRGGV